MSSGRAARAYPRHGDADLRALSIGNEREARRLVDAGEGARPAGQPGPHRLAHEEQVRDRILLPRRRHVHPLDVRGDVEAEVRVAGQLQRTAPRPQPQLCGMRACELAMVAVLIPSS